MIRDLHEGSDEEWRHQLVCQPLMRLDILMNIYLIIVLITKIYYLDTVLQVEITTEGEF